MKLRNMTSLFLEGQQGLLCLYRIGSRVADQMYVGAAGGHFEPPELNDPRGCVLREMKEELGLTEADISGLSLRYVTLRLKNDEIRQNYYFFARLATEKPLSSNEGILRWVSWEELRALKMPASARLMMNHYLKTGRYTDKMYAGITSREETRFVTLEEFEDDEVLRSGQTVTMYNKLVRNRIPELIQNQGETPYIRVLDDAEYTLHLEKKLDEETVEYRREKNLEELADILEVVFALAENLGHSRGELMRVYQRKHDARGGFDGRVFLISKDEG